MENFFDSLLETRMPMHSRLFIIRQHVIAAHGDERSANMWTNAKVGMVTCCEPIDQFSASGLKQFLWAVVFQFFEYDLSKACPFINEAVIVSFQFTRKIGDLAQP